jgi:hypothetical protein
MRWTVPLECMFVPENFVTISAAPAAPTFAMQIIAPAIPINARQARATLFRSTRITVVPSAADFLSG